MVFILLLLIVSWFLQIAEARIGLRSRFTEAIIENLEIGKSYNLRELGRIPYTVINAGDSELEIETVVEVPSKETLMEGYEPIPDPGWIKVIPDRFKIGPQEEMPADVIITIPPHKEFANRHYQAMIWSHSIGTGMFGVGVRSRLRFSTGKPPETVKKEKKKRGLLTLNLDLTPPSIYISDVKPGKKYNIKHYTGETIKITNRSDNKLKIKLIYSTEKDLSLAKDYEPADDINWLKISPKEFIIKGNTIKEIKMYLQIPDDKKHYGKKYVFIVKGKVFAKTELPLELNSRIYISTVEQGLKNQD